MSRATSINTAREQIRSQRRVVVVSESPWRWRVKSTAGTYHHEIVWDPAKHNARCITCPAPGGRCWARRRCLEWLRAELLARREAASA